MAVSKGNIHLGENHAQFFLFNFCQYAFVLLHLTTVVYDQIIDEQ